MATEGEFFKHQSVCLEVGNNQRMRLAGVSDLNFKINVFSTCFHRLTTGIDMKMWCININALSSFQFHFIKYLIQNNSRSFCKWEKLKLTEITWFTSDHTTGKWQSLNQDPGSLTPPNLKLLSNFISKHSVFTSRTYMFPIFNINTKSERKI